mgnify:CR=1 FL=1
MAQKLIIIDTDTHREVGEAFADGQDVSFPPFVAGWTDVLDCRHPPYTDKTIDENCELAHHVRKPLILVEPSQLQSDAA